MRWCRLCHALGVIYYWLPLGFAFGPYVGTRSHTSLWRFDVRNIDDVCAHLSDPFIFRPPPPGSYIHALFLRSRTHRTQCLYGCCLALPPQGRCRVSGLWKYSFCSLGRRRRTRWRHLQWPNARAYCHYVLLLTRCTNRHLCTEAL